VAARTAAADSKPNLCFINSSDAPLVAKLLLAADGGDLSSLSEGAVTRHFNYTHIMKPPIVGHMAVRFAEGEPLVPVPCILTEEGQSLQSMILKVSL
jgi:hypothetical protein